MGERQKAAAAGSGAQPDRGHAHAQGLPLTGTALDGGEPL